jgi:hypothetical protein
VPPGEEAGPLARAVPARRGRLRARRRRFFLGGAGGSTPDPAPHPPTAQPPVLRDAPARGRR